MKKIKLLCVILVLAALFAGCTEADGQGGDTPQHTDETDAAVTEAETSIPTQDVPPEELPRINLDEIVWADVVYNSTASSYRPGNFGWYIDDVVEYEDDTWYGVRVNNYNLYLFEIDFEDRSYWADGIDEDGKLTELINEYNSKYSMCMAYLKETNIGENEVMKTVEYEILRGQAIRAYSEFLSYCENYYADTEKELRAELEEETDYYSGLALRLKIDKLATKKSALSAYVRKKREEGEEARFRMAGFIRYNKLDPSAGDFSAYVCKGSDLKKIKDRVNPSFEGFALIHEAYYTNPLV